MSNWKICYGLVARRLDFGSKCKGQCRSIIFMSPNLPRDITNNYKELVQIDPLRKKTRKEEVGSIKNHLICSTSTIYN